MCAHLPGRSAPGYKMSFDHPHHQMIHRVLEALDRDLLIRTRSYFGGGTLIALQHDEYRWSKDIDFVCPVGPGYRELRTVVMDGGVEALFHSPAKVDLPRGGMVDQYGVRMAVTLEGFDEILKLEIIAESRIDLDPPENLEWSPVPVLSLTDRFAEKLLANADRWADRAMEARDLIDLCVLRLHAPIPQKSIIKAENAYPVMEPLRRAIQGFQDNPGYRDTCFTQLQVRSPRHIINGLDLLASDLDLHPTHRTAFEAGPEDEVSSDAQGR